MAEKLRSEELARIKSHDGKTQTTQMLLRHIDTLEDEATSEARLREVDRSLYELVVKERDLAHYQLEKRDDKIYAHVLTERIDHIYWRGECVKYFIRCLIRALRRKQL